MLASCEDNASMNPCKSQGKTRYNSGLLFRPELPAIRAAAFLGHT
jgi:hypothetical protein